MFPKSQNNSTNYLLINFIVEEPIRHYPNLVIIININSNGTTTTTKKKKEKNQNDKLTLFACE